LRPLPPERRIPELRDAGGRPAVDEAVDVRGRPSVGCLVLVGRECRLPAFRYRDSVGLPRPAAREDDRLPQLPAVVGPRELQPLVHGGRGAAVGRLEAVAQGDGFGEVAVVCRHTAPLHGFATVGHRKDDQPRGSFDSPTSHAQRFTELSHGVRTASLAHQRPSKTWKLSWRCMVRPTKPAGVRGLSCHHGPRRWGAKVRDLGSNESGVAHAERRL
jgi:hypothetical protein